MARWLAKSAATQARPAISATAARPAIITRSRRAARCCCSSRRCWASANCRACSSSRCRAASLACRSASTSALLVSRKPIAVSKWPPYCSAHSAFGASCSRQLIAICKSGSRNRPAFPSLQSRAVSSSRRKIRADCASSSTQPRSRCQPRIRLSCERSSTVRSASSTSVPGIRNVTPAPRYASSTVVTVSRSEAAMACSCASASGPADPAVVVPFLCERLEDLLAGGTMAVVGQSVVNLVGVVGQRRPNPPVASKSAKSIGTVVVVAR